MSKRNNEHNSDHAANHHREAAKHYKSGENERAAHHAHAAHGHSLHANHYAKESGKTFASENHQK